MRPTRRKLRTAATAAVWGMLTAAASGQGTGELTGIGTPLPREPGVLRVYSMGADATYYSVGLPYGSGALPAGTPERPALGSGGSLSLGWSDIRENSTAVVAYAGSYATQKGYAATSALNQSLSWNWQRKIKGLWDLKLSGNAAEATRDRYLYTPLSGPGNADGAALARIAFADPAPALGIDGEGGDSGRGPGVAGPGSGFSEPLVQALFGTRVLTTELTAGLAYQQSERLSWNFTLLGERMESLPDESMPKPPPPLAPISTAISGDARLQYLWSPRTTLRVDVSETRTVSRIEDMYTTRAVASITHALSERWLAEVYAGGSQISPLRNLYPLPVNLGYAAGGALAWRSFSNTLTGSVARELGDAFGLGAVHSLTGRAMWMWRRPGAGWVVQAMFAFQKLNEGASAQDWSATGAITRILNQHLATQIAYVYLQISEAPLIGLLPDQSSVRVSVTWYPGVLLYP
ncbi:MAG TPA: hypothetical protein VKV17_05845 [Bryobacteraceae bacterium]|nr:hypothetical protein [Bryobacteraceae bacterium]